MKLYLHPKVREMRPTEPEPSAPPVDRFNSDEPVTECDLCIMLFGAVALAGVYCLLWAFEWIRLLSIAMHAGVTP